MQKKIDLKTIDNENGKTFILSQDISNLSDYEKAKATNKFINNETKVLETHIEGYLRQVFRQNGINIYDGSFSALNRAFIEFETKGGSVEILDVYHDIKNEQIVGESENQMTIINDNDILECAVEVVING